MTKIKVYRDMIALCAPTQSVVVKRVFKNKNELFLIKTTKTVYDQDKHEFHYEDLTKATWLNTDLMQTFVILLMNLVGTKVSTEVLEEPISVDHVLKNEAKEASVGV